MNAKQKNKIANAADCVLDFIAGMEFPAAESVNDDSVEMTSLDEMSAEEVAEFWRVIAVRAHEQARSSK